MQLLQGDCFEVMQGLADNSVDLVLTDPPAGIGFMNCDWDKDKGGRDSWIKWMADIAAECLRVTKPGGHALVWALPRTSHWTATAWENGGWQPRDKIAHVFGTGFPKSHNGPWGGTALKPAMEDWWLLRKPLIGTVAANFAEYGTGALNIDACRVGTGEDKGIWPVTDRERGWSNQGHIGHVETQSTQGRWPANLLHDGSEEVLALFPSPHGAGIARAASDGTHRGYHDGVTNFSGAPAMRFGDSGSAARFFMTLPFEKECALCYNTCSKASNNDTENETWKIILARNAEKSGWTSQAISEFIVRVNVIGQANVSLAQNARSAGSLCDSCAMSIAVALAGIKTSAFRSEELGVILASIGSSKSSILLQNLVSFAELWGNIDTIPTTKSLSLLFGSVRDAIASSTKKASEEEAAGGNGQEKETLCRLKYCAKASKQERDAGCEGMAAKAAGSLNMRTDSHSVRNGMNTAARSNHHPTVKPIALMEYLVQLASRPGAVVLDPFMGSGTTGIACRNLGRDFIGIEMNEEYMEIAKRRLGVQLAEDLF